MITTNRIFRPCKRLICVVAYSKRLSLSSHQSENVSQTDFHDNSSTVSLKEMHQFQKYATEWWRPGGEYDALRNMNKLRVPKIQELLLNNEKPKDKFRPLDGFKVLDVGSGGGILAEPIARLGADIIGIDPLLENIEAAKNHALKDSDLHSLTYECTTIEDLVQTHANCFDIVIASEVIEHVNNPDTFIDSCCRVIKPGGHIFLTTINRNIISTLFVKYAAEYLLHIVPQGTHDEDKFVTPNEITDMLRKHPMINLNYQGMFMNPITQTWCWTDNDLMNYACWAKKTKPT